MKIACLVGVSSVAAIVALAGCGSPGRSGAGSTAPSASGKLELAAAGGAMGPVAAGGAPEIFPLRPTTYVLDRALPSLGASAVVWRMNPHPVSASDVRRFAAALGIAGAPARTATGWQASGPNSSLTFFVSAGSVEVSYGFGVAGVAGGSGSAAGSGGGVVNSASSAVPPGAAAGPTTPPAPPAPVPTIAPPVDVPNAAQAQSIARTLLDRLGVLAGQHWSADVNDSGGVAVACSVGAPCPTVPAQVFARTVTFSLTLDGLDVGGIDWSVTIGEHGRVESLNGEWAAPVPDGSYPLQTTSAAFSDLQHDTARYPGPQPMTGYAVPAADTPEAAGGAGSAVGAGGAGSAGVATPPTAASIVVHITGVSLGITRWEAYRHGSLTVDLVPTYRFHATGDGASSYDIEVLALSPTAVTFADPPVTPEPEPAQPVPPSAVEPISAPLPPPS